MGYQITIIPQDHVAYFRFQGEISVATARRAFEDYVAHPDFDPTHIMLSDARMVTHLDAGYRQIIANIFGLARPLKLFSNGATSIVLVGDETTYGMVRMLEQILDTFSAIRLTPVWTLSEAAELAGHAPALLETRLSATGCAA